MRGANSYTLAQLAAMVQLTPRVIREWMSAGLVARAPFRGVATRYTDAHLERLRAVLAQRGTRKRFGVIDATLSRRVAIAAPRPAPPPPSPVAPPAPAPEPAPLAAPPVAPAERWERIVLFPGLELHVRDDGAQALRRLADQIFAQYGPRA